MPKFITLSELRENATKQSLWVLLHGKVYNVTKFVEEHPGGDEVIMAEAGQDATEAFEDVGHSDEARGHLPGLFIGDFEQDGVQKLKTATQASQASQNASTVAKQGSNMMYFVPLGVLGAYFGWRYYSSGSL